MLTLKESYNDLSNLTWYLNKNLTKRQINTLVDIEECLKATIKKIENEIEHLKKSKENTKKLIDANIDNSDESVKEIVNNCQGQLFRINLNIEFLQKLLNDIRG